MESNTSAALGVVGQFVLGTFTADATSQVIAFNGPSGPNLNGLQLRQVGPSPAVPEPGTALAGLVLVGLCGTMRRRR